MLIYLHCHTKATTASTASNNFLIKVISHCCAILSNSIEHFQCRKKEEFWHREHFKRKEASWNNKRKFEESWFSCKHQPGAVKEFFFELKNKKKRVNLFRNSEVCLDWGWNGNDVTMGGNFENKFDTKLTSLKIFKIKLLLNLVSNLKKKKLFSLWKIPRLKLWVNLKIR